jgi:hypothetical protein
VNGVARSNRGVIQLGPSSEKLRRMKASNWGTVNSFRPWEGL